MYTERTKKALALQSTDELIAIDSRLVLSFSNALGVNGIHLLTNWARYLTMDGPADVKAYAAKFDIPVATARNHRLELRALNFIEGDRVMQPHEIKVIDTPTGFEELNRTTFYLPVSCLNDKYACTGLIILSTAYTIERVVRKRFPSNSCVYNYPLKSRGFLYPKDGKHLQGVSMDIVRKTLGIGPSTVKSYISGLGLKRASRIPHGCEKPLCRVGKRSEEYTTYRLEDSYSYLKVKIEFRPKEKGPGAPDMELLKLDAYAASQPLKVARAIGAKFASVKRILCSKKAVRLYNRMIYRGFRLKARCFKIDFTTILPYLNRYYTAHALTIGVSFPKFIDQFVIAHQNDIQWTKKLDHHFQKEFLSFRSS